jgi:hypothetical protein
MLQFWVPRTPEFEAAVVAAFRYSFLFSDFDPGTERTTVRILQALATFENVEQLSETIVARFLVDRALRQKLSLEGDPDKRVELVREALIDENKRAKDELVETTGEVRRLQGEVSESARTRGSLLTELEDKDRGLRLLEEQLTDARSVRADLERRVGELEAVARRAASEEEVRRTRRRYARQCALAGLVVVLGCVGGALVAAIVTKASGLGRREYWSIVTALWVLGVMVWARRTEREGISLPHVLSWGPFERFRRSGRRVRALLWTVVVGALGSAAWEWISRLGQH